MNAALCHPYLHWNAYSTKKFSNSTSLLYDPHICTGFIYFSFFYFDNFLNMLSENDTFSALIIRKVLHNMYTLFSSQTVFQSKLRQVPTFGWKLETQLIIVNENENYKKKVILICRAASIRLTWKSGIPLFFSDVSINKCCDYLGAKQKKLTRVCACVCECQFACQCDDLSRTSSMSCKQNCFIFTWKWWRCGRVN